MMIVVSTTLQRDPERLRWGNEPYNMHPRKGLRLDEMNDGQKKALDAQHWLQRFTPRRARSLWSKANRTKAEALIESGRMQPSGMAEIERAKRDGRWDSAYDGARSSVVPPDFQAALDSRPEARTFFGRLDGANRYAVLWRVQTAKKPETRSRRIETLFEMLARGEKIPVYGRVVSG